jgi:hypothetical protein
MFRNIFTKLAGLGKVLTLMSFDEKCAYTGGFKESFIKRPRARGILPYLIQYIQAC